MNRKIILLLVFTLLLTGCGNKKETDIKNNIEEASEENNQETEEDEEMTSVNFSDEEKNMMAGSKVSEEKTVKPLDDADSENNNVEIINGKEIVIFPNMDLNKQNSDGKYGEFFHVTYYSNTCKKERGMNISLPANYSKDKKYPVLYILHGIFGDEYSMCGDGKSGIPALLDNMMASEEASEMIVVYPFMYASKDKDQCTAIDEENVAAYDNFINELVNDIMPYMKENYSILEGKENTAVTGFSMGGREALAVGLYRPDLFGYIGSIAPAPGLVPGKDAHLNHPGQFTEEEITFTDETPFFIMMCAGDKDSVVGQFPSSYHELFNEKNIEHIWWIVPGSDHGDPAITSGIYNFAKYIFK